jgi:hypothetical protein
MRTHSTFRGGAWAVAAALTFAACHSGPRTRPSSAGLENQLNAMALTAERDSLLQEVAANGKLLGDIQGELARVVPARPATGGTEGAALEVTKDQRAFVLDQIRGITARIKTAESRLAVSERRVRRLSQANDSLKGSSDSATAEVTALSALVSGQKATITALTDQVQQLLTANMALSDSVFRLTDDHNTAYYVIGTRQELLAQGVVVEAGHRNIPLIGRRGVVPARNLPLQAFTSIDRSRIREIPLPRSDREYRIVSRQNLAYLASDSAGSGAVEGSIAIASPEGFWEPSKYLIVMEK